jgi:hypothetical protein
MRSASGAETVSRQPRLLEPKTGTSLALDECRVLGLSIDPRLIDIARMVLRPSAYHHRLPVGLMRVGLGRGILIIPLFGIFQERS